MKVTRVWGRAVVCAALAGCDEAKPDGDHGAKDATTTTLDVLAEDAVAATSGADGSGGPRRDPQGTPLVPEVPTRADAATAQDAPSARDVASERATDDALDASADGGVAWDGPTPPTLSGGTLAVTRDGATAVVSDPDTDRVLLVDFARRRAPVVIALTAGDEPGRIVEDGQRRAHVVLRGGGAILSLDLDGARPPERRPVCASPRGIAWSRDGDVLHVACMGGELVTLPAAGGAVTRRVHLAPDLRDVVVHGNRLLVTRFRAAEVLTVDERGAVTQREVAPDPLGMTPAVAWRAVAAPEGGLWLLRQHSLATPFARSGNAYYDSAGGGILCNGMSPIVRPALVRVRPPFATEVLPQARLSSLAVDVAPSPDGTRLAVALPGNFGARDRAQVALVPIERVERCDREAPPTFAFAGQVVAVAWRPSGELVVQTRAPAAVVEAVTGTVHPLGGPSTPHPGHALFHANPTGFVTCASCHPEGEDDGIAWRFNGDPARRTQYLRGGLVGTEPFHWSGDVPDFSSLVAEVLVRRMGAPTPTAAETAHLARWIDGLRPPAAAPPDAAAARGAALFRDPAVGCATCHAGPRFTNGASADVGSGGSFQVPPLLGLAARAPYLHDGCARTLRDALDACGGGERHGHTAALTAAQRDDLLAFLGSL